MSKLSNLLERQKTIGPTHPHMDPDAVNLLREALIEATGGVVAPRLDELYDDIFRWFLEAANYQVNIPNIGLVWEPVESSIESAVSFISYSGLPGVTSITSPTVSTDGNIVFVDSIDLESLSFPKLVSLPFGYLQLINCPKLNTLFFPSLASQISFQIINCDLLPLVSFPFLSGSKFSFQVNDNAILTSVSLPSFVSADSFTTTIQFVNNPALSIVVLSSFVPLNTKNFTASGCALSAASVNHILARHVANAAYVSGTVTLNGGTNAAPTGQGITDKTTLQGRGVTVLTN